MESKRRVACKLMLILGLVAFLGEFSSQPEGVRASGEAAQWYGPFQNGCFALGDGVTYTLQSCARADGAFDVYVASNGQWYWSYVAGWDNNGCYFAWDGTQYLAYQCLSVVQQGQPGYSTSTFVVGGTSLEPEVVITDGWSGSGYITIGGDSLPTTGSWTSTGIPELDTYMMESNDRNVMIWLSPKCDEIIDYTCVR